MPNPTLTQSLAARGITSNSNTVIILGDSITAQSSDAAPNVSPTSYNANGFFAVANVLCGHRFELLNNAGISGQTSAQILARFDTDVAPYKPATVIVLAGQNDTTASLPMTGAGSSIENLRAIYDKVRAIGANLIACTMSPTSQLISGGDQGARRQRHTITNSFIREYVRLNKAYIADFDYALSDTDLLSSSIAWANALRDGVHPSYEGVWRYMAPCLAEVLDAIVPPRDFGSGAGSNRWDARNYGFNGAAFGDNATGVNSFALTTGFTGTGPHGWSTRRRNAGSGVCSKAARPSGWRRDDMARMVCSFTALGDRAGFYVGSDDVLGTGRYDSVWAATSALPIGARRRPTVANGYVYLAATAGTTGGSEPVWPTQEGASVTDSGVIWMCFKMPSSGDKFYAACDIMLSGLTASKGALASIILQVIDTTGATVATAGDMVTDFNGTLGAMPTVLPSGLLRYRTPVITLPALVNPVRYMPIQIMAQGEAGATLTMDVARVELRRVE